MVTEKMIEAAADAMSRQDITFANCDRSWKKRTIRAALEAALSKDAEPVQSRNDDAGYVEFANEDVPYIVREIEGRVAILTALETRNIIGYRVYDPNSSFAPPAPSVAVKADREAIARIIDPHNFMMTGGDYGTDAEGFKNTWAYMAQRVALTKADCVIAALSAQVQDVATMPIPQNKETLDQVAAVMLLNGTPEQQVEALRYSAAPAAKLEGKL